MANVKISELPIASGNTFNSIFPQVKEGTTNQIALSGFNTNDFTNVVNLGTGFTSPQTIIFDGSLGDTFVYTWSGDTGSNVSISATTQNMVNGKIYTLIHQGVAVGGNGTYYYKQTNELPNYYVFSFQVENNKSQTQLAQFVCYNNIMFPVSSNTGNLTFGEYRINRLLF